MCKTLYKPFFDWNFVVLWYFWVFWHFCSAQCWYCACAKISSCPIIKQKVGRAVKCIKHFTNKFIDKNLIFWSYLCVFYYFCSAQGIYCACAVIFLCPIRKRKVGGDLKYLKHFTNKFILKNVIFWDIFVFFNILTPPRAFTAHAQRFHHVQ